MKTLIRALAALVFLVPFVAVGQAACINPPVFEATMQPRPAEWHRMPKKDAVPFVAAFNDRPPVSNYKADFILYGHFGTGPRSWVLAGFFLNGCYTQATWIRRGLFESVYNEVMGTPL